MNKDTRLLRDAHRRAGVREYWLIDARGAEIRFEILTSSGTAMNLPADPFATASSAVLGGRWTLSRTRNRAGRYTYDVARTE